MMKKERKSIDEMNGFDAKTICRGILKNKFRLIAFEESNNRQFISTTNGINRKLSIQTMTTDGYGGTMDYSVIVRLDGFDGSNYGTTEGKQPLEYINAVYQIRRLYGRYCGQDLKKYDRIGTADDDSKTVQAAINDVNRPRIIE